jgi:hypothetical protein
MNDKGRPEEGKVYALTGGAGRPSIASGNTWEESEVKPEDTQDPELVYYELLATLSELGLTDLNGKADELLAEACRAAVKPSE